MLHGDGSNMSLYERESSLSEAQLSLIAMPGRASISATEAYAAGRASTEQPVTVSSGNVPLMVGFTLSLPLTLIIGEGVTVLPQLSWMV